MCLKLLVRNKIETSDKPIVVYKVLEKTNGFLRSPYRKKPYRLGELKTVKSFGVEYRTGHNSTFRHARTALPKKAVAVYEGLHAFHSLKRAKDSCFFDNVVVRSTIPAGTPFIKGECEIVSLKLQVGKKVSYNYDNYED